MCRSLLFALSLVFVRDLLLALALEMRYHCNFMFHVLLYLLS